jgi:hypothetical protein
VRFDKFKRALTDAPVNLRILRLSHMESVRWRWSCPGIEAYIPLPINAPTSADILSVHGMAVEDYMNGSSRVLAEPMTIPSGIGSLSGTIKRFMRLSSPSRNIRSGEDVSPSRMSRMLDATGKVARRPPRGLSGLYRAVLSPW